MEVSSRWFHVHASSQIQRWPSASWSTLRGSPSIPPTSPVNKMAMVSPRLNESRHMMRKRMNPQMHEGTASECDWLNVEELADVEITSEDPAYPVESALVAGLTSGWRAAEPGDQTIRLLFNRPQQLKRIWINFVELEAERTQEYVLRWSSDNGQSFREIVRQQWNFSPPHTTNEIEDHHVELPATKILELSIKPDISNGPAVASLSCMRLA